MADSPKVLEWDRYVPWEPIKWKRPLDKALFKHYRQIGYIDENGYPTELGRTEGKLCKMEIDGNETEEHFQMRLEIYKRKLPVFFDWFERRWGEGKYFTGNYADFPKNIPFPKDRMDAIVDEVEKEFKARQS